MYLPLEIIKEVGNYLNPSEQGSCIRVCYDWYEPFLELLYTKVHIQTRHQFRLFYRTIQSSADIEDSLGNHVKQLIFAHDANHNDYTATTTLKRQQHYHPVGLTQEELETFPTYFKNLELLDFDTKLWKHMRYSDKFADMKVIRQLPELNRTVLFQPIIDSLAPQLTYLALGGDITDHLVKKNLTTSIWLRIPKLEQLIIRGNNYTSLNVKMIMALGAQLPRLKHLTLSCVTLPLDEYDMTSTTTFPLFTSAQSLTLDDVHLKNWRMITFLSLAFYHVEVLDFDVTFDWFSQDNMTAELYEQSIDAYMGFAQLCIFLKKVKFRRIGTSVFPFPYDSFFHQLAAIHQNDVEVEMSHAAWESTIDPAASFRAVTKHTGLLEKVGLRWSWTARRTDTSLFKYLGFCPRLTQLYLKCDVLLKNGIRLDFLLEHCRHLQDLRITQGFVTISGNGCKSLDAGTTTGQPQRQHGLLLLELKDAVLGDRLMDYVAQTCPYLEALWISDCVQEKPPVSAFLVIRMPEHRFKSIKLDSLHLNAGGVNGKCETSIALLSFYESSRYASQVERKKVKNEGKGKKYNKTAATTTTGEAKSAEMWRFYHAHKWDAPKKERLRKQLRRLSTAEAANIAKHEMNEKMWKSIRNSPRRKTFQEWNLWEKDIRFGTVLLVCKFVERLEFNGLKV